MERRPPHNCLMRRATTRLMRRNSDTRDNFLLWFIQEFGFNANAVTALYDVQMLKDAKTLSELDDDPVANICKAVSKDTSQSVAKIATTKLKLACFWISHQHRTLREIGVTSRPLVKIDYSGAIELLQQQKQDMDNWATNNKEPDYPPLTLDTSTATRVFDKVKTLLGRVRGVTGMPLEYVIRVALVPEDENDDPPFGDEESKYISIDMEMIARTPILSNDADIYGGVSGNLKAHGPFVPTFPTDAKKFEPSFLHVLASQARGNTSRNSRTSRTGIRLGVPSTIISLGGTR
jgi:hypothetical protein